MNSMHILKFGGTSVGSVKSIEQVIQIVSNQSQKQSLIVVVSAVGGVTDLLIKAGSLAAQKDDGYKDIINKIHEKHIAIADGLIANDDQVLTEISKRTSHLSDLLNGIYLINELSPKTLDKLASFGELMSSFLINAAFKSHGLDSVLKDSRELIITNDQHTKAGVLYEATNKNIVEYFTSNTNQITVLGGFIASTLDGETSTLGRGGSDFTAAIIAAALDVDRLEIWTDVSGMYSANPKLVKQAKPIKNISYQEAMELSHFGAKVLYPPTIVPVLSKNIPIYIKNTMAAGEDGTRIGNQTNDTSNLIKGISHISDIALLTLEGAGMVGISGISKRLFDVLSQQQVNIIMITQASSEHSICIGLMETDALRAKNAIETEFAYEKTLNRIDPVVVETSLSIIAVVGESMKSHQGISGKMFSTLGKNNVNIRAIAQGASEKNISAVIAKKDVKKALNSLHEVFFDGNRKQINLFVTGVGNVGAKLLEQIHQQKHYLKDNLNLSIRVLGLSNSRKMVVSDTPIPLDQWESKLANGEEADILRFRESVINLNQRNSVFVDITANEPVAMAYEEYLRNSIAVVACNKIAAAGKQDYYANLKRLSRKYNAPFMFETNVGAGLPIIDTLQNLITSGDRITKVQAVLSGSLNFVFNNFKSGDSFHDVVQQAKDEGYTEPDPRIDLSGVDVARKILILARESGLELELEDIKNEPFLTEKNLNSTDVPHFFETLKEDAAHFEDLVSKATTAGKRLKYVAQLDDGKASVGLQAVGSESPFYNLEGSDNIVLFYTERYPKQPLIVKGAGAGGEVTASGLFSDIIRLR